MTASKRPSGAAKVAEEYKRKLISADDAVKVVKSGHRVNIGLNPAVPQTLVDALLRRLDSGVLHGLRVNHTLPRYNFPWFQASWKGWEEDWIEEMGMYIHTPVERPLVDQKFITHIPMSSGLFVKPAELDRGGWSIASDVFMLQCTPPDKDGYCSYGHAIWYSQGFLRNAGKVIAEVNDKFIRPKGDKIHISQIDHFVLPEAKPMEEGAASISALLPIPPDEEPVVEVILTTVGDGIIKDGDTVMIGGGSVSSRLTYYLGNRQELGFHSEMLPVGAVDLVKAGVVTGKKKTHHQGKVVCTAIMETPENLKFVNENDTFQIFGIEYTNSVKTIVQHDNMVAVNTALAIDLMGQICSESIGPRQWSGIGGQFEFCMGALSAKDGKSIHVIQSTARKGTVSRIMPRFPEGTVVSVPRHIADYVVTEHGVANLQGKSLRQRAEALIEIAHPDFRAELRKEARKMWWR